MAELARRGGVAGPIVIWSAHTVALDRARTAATDVRLVETVDLPDLVGHLEAVLAT